MSVLKVKDGNQWVGIPSIKGDKGDSPVLTSSKSGKTTTIYSDGTQLAQIQDGADGVSSVTDVQINGSSILSSGVANVPVASSNEFGVATFSSNNGIAIAGSGAAYIYTASNAEIKAGSNTRHPITSSNQDSSVFYGLAKIAGADEKNSTLTAGTYTETALSKISDMLNAPVSVSGSTPSITAKSGVRYICGECSTLSITAPASGDIEVIFESGSTATVLTLASAKTGVTSIKFPSWFDQTHLESNVTYDMIITNGEFGVVTSWA